MTQLIGPPVVLDGPRPQAPEYNLLSTVPVVDGGRALLGGNVFAYPGGFARQYPGCATGTFADKDLTSEWENPFFLPFAIYYPVVCSAMDLTRDEIEGRALTVFEAVESQAVEAELLAGIANPTNPHLNDANVQFLKAATGPMEGLALLERAIASTGRQGVIHADPGVASLWGHTLDTDGTIARTALGTPLVIGSGYAVASLPDDLNSATTLYPPSGQAALNYIDGGYAYATGPLIVARGGVDVLFSFDQSVNGQVALIERTYLVAWDTQLQAAVGIDFTTTP